jgi:hypothetical protein
MYMFREMALWCVADDRGGARNLITNPIEHASLSQLLYNEVRTHLSRGKDAPCTRPVERFGSIVAQPILGELHYWYARI